MLTVSALLFGALLSSPMAPVPQLSALHAGPESAVDAGAAVQSAEDLQDPFADADRRVRLRGASAELMDPFAPDQRPLGPGASSPPPVTPDLVLPPSAPDPRRSALAARPKAPPPVAPRPAMARAAIHPPPATGDGLVRDPFGT